MTVTPSLAASLLTPFSIATKNGLFNVETAKPMVYLEEPLPLVVELPDVGDAQLASESARSATSAEVTLMDFMRLTLSCPGTPLIPERSTMRQGRSPTPYVARLRSSIIANRMMTPLIASW